MNEERDNLILERWIQAEMRADRLQQQLDIRKQKRQEINEWELLAEAHNAIDALRAAIIRHRQTINSPASPELAGIVDRTLWAILDRVPNTWGGDEIDE